MTSSAAINRAEPLPETAPPSNDAASTGFEAGVVNFAAKLRNFVRKRVGDATDAEDVVQDVLLKVFRSRGRLRDAGRLEAWIYQTARSTIVDYYRRRRPLEQLPRDLADSIAPRDEVGESLRASVRAVLATLPETYRRPLVLAEFHGKTAAQIARDLRLSLTATKSRLARGRALLRKRLLACCAFESDAYGHVIAMKRRQPTCACACESSVESGGAPAHGVRIAVAREADMPAIQDLQRSENLPSHHNRGVRLHAPRLRGGQPRGDPDARPPDPRIRQPVSGQRGDHAQATGSLTYSVNPSPR